MTNLRNQHEEETRPIDTSSIARQGDPAYSEQTGGDDTSRNSSQSVVEISDAEEDTTAEADTQSSGYLSSKASMRRSRIQQRLEERLRERSNGSHTPNTVSRPKRGQRPQRDRVGLFTNAEGLNRLSDTSNEVEIVREIVFQHNVNHTENREFDPSLITADNREVIDLEVNDNSLGDVAEVPQRNQSPQATGGDVQQESDVENEDMEILQQTNTINTNPLPADVMTDSNYIQIQLPGNNNMYVYDRNGSMQRDRASFESTMLRNYERERSQESTQQRHLRRLNRGAERQRNQLMHVSRRATDSILLGENEGLFLVDDDQNLQSVNTAEPSRFQPITAANSQVVAANGPSVRNSNATDVPMSVRRLRQQLATQRRMQVMQQRRAQQMLQRASGHADLEVNTELTDVREKIAKYPLAIKKAFDDCETLFTFQQTVNRTMPTGATEAIKNLKNLFIRYRSIRGNSRLEQYTQAVETTSSAVVASRVSEPHYRRGHHRNGYEEESATREAGRDYMRFRRNMGLGQSGNDAMRGPTGESHRGDDDTYRRAYLESGYFAPMLGNEEETTRSIIQMIERREAAERSALTNKFSESTEAQKNKIYGKAGNLPSGYTSSFSSDILMNRDKMQNTNVSNGNTSSVVAEVMEGYEKVPICVLCGVELGMGIPLDFEGKRSIDQSFEYMVEKYGVACPFQALTRPTDYDRECSKRCFVAKPCGHVFCGRCVLRVNHATRLSAGAKKSMSRFKGPSNPNNYGPNTCVGENCHVKLRKKGAFQEVFL